MTITTKTLASALALALVSLANSGSSEASEAAILKPLQGISFASDSGTRGVGYFLPEAGGCKVVLTLTGAENSRGFTVVRHETLVPSGERGGYGTDSGTFEFSCRSGAVAMDFRFLSKVADVGIDH